MSRKTTGWVLGVMIAIIPWQDASAQNARPSTEQLVYRLTQAPPIEREATVAYLLTLDAAQTEPAIWRALASELKRLDELRRHRRALAQKGAVLDDFPAEYHALVIEVISRSQDPIVVSALVGSLDTGRMAGRAMAKFDAVEVVREVLPIAEGQGDPHPGLIAGAMHALESALSAPSATRLSSDAVVRIRALARTRLAGLQDPMVVAAACGLAHATDDPGLKRRADRLADSAGELVEMGVSERFRAIVQKECRESAVRHKSGGGRER